MKMSFGANTTSHKVLARLDEAFQRNELDGGVELIKGLSGQRTVPFDFSYGHQQRTYISTSLVIPGESGCPMVFNPVRASIDFISSHVFELPGFYTKSPPPFSGEYFHA